MPERKLDYLPIDNKADAGFSLESPSLERLYVDAGLALMDMTAKLDRVQDLEKKSLEASGKDMQKLMKHWLDRLIELFQKDKWLAKRIYFEKFDGKQIKAILMGEPYEATRHGSARNFKTTDEAQMKIKFPSAGSPLFSLMVFFKG